jgi:hypothetical protein
MPMRVEQVGADAQVEQLAHGVGLQVDAHAQRLAAAARLRRHDAGHADLVQGEGQRHAADAAAGDQHQGQTCSFDIVSARVVEAGIMAQAGAAMLRRVHHRDLP